MEEKKGKSMDLSNEIIRTTFLKFVSFRETKDMKKHNEVWPFVNWLKIGSISYYKVISYGNIRKVKI